MSPDYFVQSPVSVILSWTPSTDFACVTINYTLTLTNITEGNMSYIYNTNNNATNVTLSDLTQGADYIFTVAGIDVEGRVGEKSVPSKILTFDGEEFSHDVC